MKKNKNLKIALVTLSLSYVLTVILFLLDSISFFPIAKVFPFLENDLFLNCSGIGFWLNCEMTLLGWMLVDIIIFTILAISIFAFSQIKR